MIIAFDKQLHVLTHPTSDRSFLADAISRVRTGGGTAIYDSIDEVIISRLKRTSGRLPFNTEMIRGKSSRDMCIVRTLVDDGLDSRVVNDALVPVG